MSIKKRRMSEVLISELLFLCPELDINTLLLYCGESIRTKKSTSLLLTIPGSADVATCNCVLAATKFLLPLQI